MTQAQLAEASEIAVETLSRIERGCMSPSVEMLERLSRGLEIEVASMLSADPAVSEPSSLRPADRSMLTLMRRLDPDDASRLVKAVRTLVEIGASTAAGGKPHPRGRDRRS